ncbi:TetR family transcriptional regulator C-terminal domain-containing protein [Streptomyces sp. CA-142005]|uniref:TetR family transcriptional regulator C-terminal domain-containing protein n=1 Tax=Streptomyces sp. CA-142005 TaxID=3240052 RepID=UPI003D8AFAE8
MANVRSALRAALMAMAEEDLCAPEQGCFLVNAATEPSADPPTVDRVGGTLRLVESAITGALERTQTRGELSTDKDPARLARFLTAFIQGRHVMGKAHVGRAFMESAVSNALTALD